MERCCRSTGTRTAHIWNDCREWSTPNVCTTVDHGNSVASWFGVPEPGGGRNIRERKSALHTNFWEDVKYYGACEGRNRGFRPFPTALRSPFSQFWSEGAVPAKLPPKGPLSGPHMWGLYKIIPTILFTFPAKNCLWSNYHSGIHTSQNVFTFGWYCCCRHEQWKGQHRSLSGRNGLEMKVGGATLTVRLSSTPVLCFFLSLSFLTF